MLKSPVRLLLAALFLPILVPSAGKGAERPLTFEDMMRFAQVEQAVISSGGEWAACTIRPDRGDGEVLVVSIGRGTRRSVARGARPLFSPDARWLAAELKKPALELEKAGEEKPPSDAVLVDLSNGDTLLFGESESFRFSEDGRWFASHRKAAKEPGGKKDRKDSTGMRPRSAELTGRELLVRDLREGKTFAIPFVLSFAFDSTSRYLACAVGDTTGEGSGLAVRDLREWGKRPDTVYAGRNAFVSSLTWTGRTLRLAYLAAAADTGSRPGPASLRLWDGETGLDRELLPSEGAGPGWMIPSKNELTWSEDGARLFLGRIPLRAEAPRVEEPADPLFDRASIVAGAKVDVWHWNDPAIIPHQKKRWKTEKDRTYTGVLHLETERFVPLADSSLPHVGAHTEGGMALGFNLLPYEKELTWEGELEDAFVVSLADGRRTPVAARLAVRARLSPGGGYVLFWKEGHWHLFDAARASARNLTLGLKVSFADEEEDVPGPAQPCGWGGWVERDGGVLLYDRYDIWYFPLPGGEPVNLTRGAGRERRLVFRSIRTDPAGRFFGGMDTLLVSAEHDSLHHVGLYLLPPGGSGGPVRIVEEPRRYTFLARSKGGSAALFTRETYSEFPDLWAGDRWLGKRKRLTEANPRMEEFAWGSAELVEWLSMDGAPLQGVLIKPAGFREDIRYPVLVYFYERMADRLHVFNPVTVNHRPCFPFYAGNGYALFLPDVRYREGEPGQSALKCILPGVQMLVERGVADPRAVALHGHSWGGYQTAYVVTQTGFFAAAVAGAPVSNMTSAYSGLRLETGLARQFQYERGQSRIGGSLWEYPERYLRNSPLFEADRITTPLLIEVGDEDEAVPWHQGVELFLAMRRLGKPCVMLQYRGEKHHPQSYAHRLDYSIRFKEFLDHYLKKAPAPAWLKQGVRYTE
ncbi:MAG: prolyl oligopeptidase family serine peptidase [Bacteroidota bacterium]